MKRIWLIGSMLVALAAPVMAADAAPPAPAKPAAGEWQDAELGPMVGKGEAYRSTTLVTVAYGFIWLMVCGFVASVWLRGRKVENELEELKRALLRRGAGKG